MAQSEYCSEVLKLLRDECDGEQEKNLIHQSRLSFPFTQRVLPRLQPEGRCGPLAWHTSGFVSNAVSRVLTAAVGPLLGDPLLADRAPMAASPSLQSRLGIFQLDGFPFLKVH